MGRLIHMRNSHRIIKTPVGYVKGWDIHRAKVTYTDFVKDAKTFETYERAAAFQKYMDGLGGFQKSASLIFTVEHK